MMLKAHYGVIVSSNQVMRDPRTRDDLAKPDSGNHEDSAVTNGIYNYCDPHMNKGGRAQRCSLCQAPSNRTPRRVCAVNLLWSSEKLQKISCDCIVLGARALQLNFPSSNTRLRGWLPNYDPCNQVSQISIHHQGPLGNYVL